jgi:predicted AlkP superfamily phosphohydrolase/phosphomutase
MVIALQRIGAAAAAELRLLMRYLRMFVNSALGGALGAAFITILVLQLNPHLPLDWFTVAPLFARMALFYAVHLAVGFYAALVVWQLFGNRIASPGWISLRLMSWLGTFVVSAAAGLMWFNLSSFQIVLEEDSVRRLAAAAGATTVCAALLAVITLVHYSFGRRGSRVGGTLLVLTLAASLLFPLTARGWGHPRPLVARSIDLGTGEPAEAEGPRVVLLALDGASLDYISLKTAEGRLPNFGRILAGGAAMHLTTLRPTQPATVWSAVSTGKFPQENGIRSAAMYGFAQGRTPIELLPDLCFAHALVHVGILREVSLHSSSLRARPIWTILSTQRVPSGIVGWPLTAPAEALRGFLISDRFHLRATATLELTDGDLGYPPQAVLEARVLQQSRGLSSRESPLERPPLARDAQYREVGALLRSEYRPRFFALRYEGLDRAGHQFLRYAMPREFGDVSSDERQRYGTVLDAHYAFIDAEVGTIIATLGADDVLFVVSGFGMEPVSFGKRLLARLLSEPDQTGSHEGAPDGFLLGYGGPIKPGRATLGSVVDVAPTVLYFLGLPIARDMDGIARTDIFTPEFTSARPITFIPTYER